MKKTGKTVEEKLMRARSLLITRVPFFATLVMSMDIKEVSPDEVAMPTMATDGKDIIYVREFVESLTEAELLFVLCHETLHAALGHVWRRDNREPTVFNVAADYVVNQMIDEVFEAYTRGGGGVDRRFMTAPKDSLIEPKYAGKSVEEVYRLLMNDPNLSFFEPQGADGEGEGKGEGEGQGQGNDQSGKSSKRGKNSKNGKSGKGKQSDDGDGQGNKRVHGNGSRKVVGPANHGLWKQQERLNEAEKQRRQLEWRSRMIAAAQQMRQCGSMPAGLSRMMGKLQRPQIDWRQALQEFIVNIVNDYGWTPPDKRVDADEFGVYMPSFSEEEQELSSVLMYADASGSMSVRDVTAVVSEVKGIVEQYRVPVANSKLFWFDAEVVEPGFDLDDLGENFEKLECAGGGGTSFHACAEHAVQFAKSVDEPIKFVMMLTDGYAGIPDEASWGNVPVIWLLTTPPEELPEINYGRILYVDPATLSDE